MKAGLREEIHTRRMSGRLMMLKDNRLNAADADRLREHLATCAACTHEWNRWNRMAEGLATLRDEHAPPHFRQRVLSRLDAESARHNKPAATARIKTGWRWAPVPALAAAMLLVVVLKLIPGAAPDRDTQQGSDQWSDARGMSPSQQGPAETTTLELNVAVADVHAAARQVNQLLIQAGVTESSTERSAPDAMVIEFELPAAKRKEFLVQLKAIGSLNPPAPAEGRTANDKIRVTLTPRG